MKVGVNLGIVVLIVLAWLPAWAGAESPVVVEKGVVRLMPPGITTTALYFTVQNNTGQALILQAVELDWAGRAELHGHQVDKVTGMAQMRAIEGVQIAPQSQLGFVPGGRHVMVFGLEKTLQEGQRLPMQLGFASGQRIETHVVVKKHVQS